jgi:NADH:ubiquinone oxidoreductase subunit 2 (subunit N)
VKSERRTGRNAIAQVVLCSARWRRFHIQSVNGSSRLYLSTAVRLGRDVEHPQAGSVCSGPTALVYSRQYLLDRGLLQGEFVTLLLFALLGMMVMISANSFLTAVPRARAAVAVPVRDGGARTATPPLRPRRR